MSSGGIELSVTVACARVARSDLPTQSGVRYDLADLCALESDGIGHVRAHPLLGVCRSLLGFEHEHRKTGVVSPRPVTGYESRSLRDARHDLIAQTSHSLV